mmetsp:Transcript_12158/g.41296  ORF Transcript_12158/g.41296 Transcript_12158/m.41296 type:complete len:425 (+) Transcript_12158:1047-2321(+)
MLYLTSPSCSRRPGRSSSPRQCTVSRAGAASARAAAHALSAAIAPAAEGTRKRWAPTWRQPSKAAGAVTASASSPPGRITAAAARSPQPSWNLRITAGSAASTRAMAGAEPESTSAPATVTKMRSAASSAVTPRAAASFLRRSRTTRAEPSSPTRAPCASLSASIAASSSAATRASAASASARETLRSAAGREPVVEAATAVRVAASTTTVAAGQEAPAPRAMVGCTEAAEAIWRSLERDTRRPLPRAVWPTTSATDATRDAAASTPSENASTMAPLVALSQAFAGMPWSAGVVPVRREMAAATRSRGAKAGRSATLRAAPSACAVLGIRVARSSAERPLTVSTSTPLAGRMKSAAAAGSGAGKAVGSTPAMCATSGATLVSATESAAVAAARPAALPCCTRYSDAAWAFSAAGVITMSPKRPG